MDILLTALILNIFVLHGYVNFRFILYKAWTELEDMESDSKVLEYETFLNERLREDLRFVIVCFRFVKLYL